MSESADETFDQAKARLVEWIRVSESHKEARRTRIQRERAALKHLQANLEHLASRVDPRAKRAGSVLAEALEQAQKAAADLPAVQSRPWLDQVAFLYLLLRLEYRLPVSSYGEGEMVDDFMNVLLAAGRGASQATAKRLLLVAYRQWEDLARSLGQES